MKIFNNSHLFNLVAFSMKVVLLLSISLPTWGQEQNDLENEVQVLYSKWLIEHEIVGPSSSSYDFYKLDSFQKIVKKGIKVIPIVMKTINKHDAFQIRCLTIAIEDILQMRFADSYLKLDAESKYAYLKEWLLDNKRIIKEEWEVLYDRWAKLEQSSKLEKGFTYDWDEKYGDDIHARYIALEEWKEMPEGPEKERMRPYNRTVYQRLLDLGIPALPYAVEEIKKGDKDLLEAVNLWTDSSLQEYASQKNKNLQSLSEDDLKGVVTQWWEENKEKYKLPE